METVQTGYDSVLKPLYGHQHEIITMKVRSHQEGFAFPWGRGASQSTRRKERLFQWTVTSSSCWQQSQRLATAL